MLGGWDESSVRDKEIVEELSGKAYGEWIETIRETLNRPDTPLQFSENAWKFVDRYEGWFTLGMWIFDVHLDRFKNSALKVFRERDLKFELPKNERYAAALYFSKIRFASTQLRFGLADTIALLGSHPGI